MSAAPSLPDFPPRDDGAAVPCAAPPLAGLAWRRAERADLAFLRELYATTRATELAPLRWPDAVLQAFVDQQFALQHAHYLGHYADADFLLVTWHGQPVGRCYLQRAAPAWLVVDISLLPRVQGRGIGSALLAHAQREAAASGCDVRLHVLHGNEAALRLYLRMGFTVATDQASATHQALIWRHRTG